MRDALVLQTLSDALWDELQTKAPSSNAFYVPNDHRFSQTIRGHTSEYGPLRPWLLFQEKILGFSRSRQYVIVTDIANYYDFISYGHLRNILAELSIQKEHSLDLLIYTLSHMLWQPDYMPRVEVGLPQTDLDAARMLAHCFLFEVDKLVVGFETRVEYARYMDDIDIGVDTLADAKSVLRDLDLTLQTRQIRLNSGKTKILSRTQAQRHFRIRENAFLHRLEDSIAQKSECGCDITRERSFLSWAIREGLRSQAFVDGNGEKILKRLINYARKFGAAIDADDVRTILLRWPGSRRDILRWWQHSPCAAAMLNIMADVVGSPEIVDEAAIVAMVNALVAARLPSDGGTDSIIGAICQRLNSCRIPPQTRFFAELWLLSRYGNSWQLMRLIESTGSLWMSDEYLSRLVGGLYPRLIGSAYGQKFQSTVARSGSRPCQQVFDFHNALATTAERFRAVKKFVRAANSSETEPDQPC